MERSGARNVGEAVALARTASQLDGVRYEGISGYEGHCMGMRDREEREAAAQRAAEKLTAFVTALRDQGLDPPSVSAGGTGTYELAGRHPLTTEIQPGSYLLMDRFHAG